MEKELHFPMPFGGVERLNHQRGPCVEDGLESTAGALCALCIKIGLELVVGGAKTSWNVR